MLKQKQLLKNNIKNMSNIKLSNCSYNKTLLAFSSKSIFQSFKQINQLQPTNQLKSFFKTQNKYFCTESIHSTHRIKVTDLNDKEDRLILTDQEALLYNEHDHNVLLLKSNSVPTKDKKLFMNELLLICFDLSKYKNYLRGWDYLEDYFKNNMEKLNNEEFFNYIEKFSIIKLDIGEELWIKAFENFLGRKASKSYFLNLVECFSFLLSEKTQNKFYGDIIKKIKNENIELNSNEYLVILSNAGWNLNTISESYWKDLKTYEKYDFNLCSDTAIINLVNLSYRIKLNKVNKGDQLYNSFKDYVMANIHNLSLFTLPYLFQLYVFMNDMTMENASKTCIIIGSSYKMFPTNLKVDFMCALLEACYLFPKLREQLSHNKTLLSNFHIPSQDVCDKYKKERELLQKNNPSNNDNIGEQIIKKKEIVKKFIDLVGLNKNYVNNYDSDTNYAHNELRSFSKRFKKE